MRIYRLAGWLALAGLFTLLGTLRYEPPSRAYAVDLPAVYAQIDTTTYGDARIVYKLSTDTLRNSNGDLRRLPDLSAAPTGSRWRVIWKPSTFDSVMLVTGDTFALSPMDSADATALATSWGVTDPHTVTLAWHVPPGAAPDPLENVAVAAVHDTLRTSWTSVGDSVRIFSGLDAGGEEDTFYVAGSATPHDRVVTAEGDYFSCGNTYTTQAEGDYAANRCGSATIDTTEPGGGEEFPNEPAGLTTIAQQSWGNAVVSSPAVESDFTSPEIGAGSVDLSDLSRMEIVSDGTAPAGSGRVFRGKFPDGWPDGGSPWRFDVWGSGIDEGGGSHQYDEIYISTWVKIEGSDYQDQSVGTKLFYFSYGTASRHNDGFLQSFNSGTQQLRTSLPYIAKLSENNPDDTPGQSQPIAGGANIPVGSWTQVELYAKINDIGSANGILKLWLGGNLRHDVSNWIYRSAANPRAFYSFQFTPVYGGNSGDVRTRDDFWRVAEVYISAKS